MSAHPEWWKVSLEEMLSDLNQVPESFRTAVRHNGGGVYNHQFFFAGLRNQGGRPKGKLWEQINWQYGSLSSFFIKWTEAALSVFGSGYAWLVTDDDKRLQIITTANQDTPLELHLSPLLVIDVWEHAYYLKHKNLRTDYVDDWWKVVNWERAELLYGDV